ncbi:MAG: hypothetical protein CVU05_11060 [Bacteroidetes bacterium HGW-Bacteroidetes-21]|nr:MAG: hypothetical protein CVU05_11060 [Bacteroidetes bacterium HGW-Bacteroidetes-21]
MKRFTILALLALFSMTFSYGQKKSLNPSPGFANKDLLETCDAVLLPGLNEDYIKAESLKLPKDGQVWEIGRAIPAGLTMENSGTWFDLADGKRVWMLRVKTPGAIGLTAEIFDFHIPVGSEFYVYDPAGKTRYGKYTMSDNGDFFGSDIIVGDEIVFEYVETSETVGDAHFTIKDIMHLYRGVQFTKETKDFGDSESCEVNIVCSPAGDSWTTQKQGVARIYVVMGTSAGWCTGTLINNTAQDCKKYFLSAYHCYDGASASNLTQWRFYFNYQSATCTNPTSQPSYNMMTGCTLKSSGNISGGSDFILLELTGTISAAWNLYMNGWNRATTPAGPGVSIHHPAGDIKKISKYTTLTSSTWSGGATSAHWRVTWTNTGNGTGVTEGGSSGSPLFDNTGRVIGTLTGGGSYCTATTQPDYYGKFSYHWASNGTTDAAKLQPWLDPANTTTTLGGMTCPATTTTLTAAFTGTPTSVNIGGTVTYTSQSTGNVTSYSWSFPGGTPSTSTAASPTVVYNTAGQYNASLTVGDGSTTNTLNKTNYITVSSCSVDGYHLDFECNNDFDLAFSPWTVNDVDLLTTYGIDDGSGGSIDFTHTGEAMAFIAFNPASTTPASTSPAPHGGVRFGACFAGIPGTVTANNDWLISPKVQLGTNSTFTLWVKSNTATYGLERFKIGVSTTNNTPASFSIISAGAYETAPDAAWTLKTYSLATYNNQQVYVGINCVSADAFIFMVDDININTSVDALNVDPNVSYINVYPNPANDYLFIDYKSVGDDFRSIEVYNSVGQLINNIGVESANSTIKVLDISGLEKGVYIVKVNTARGTKIEKVAKY